MQKQRLFSEGDYVHICNKSISNYTIFKEEAVISRFLLTVNYYNDTHESVCLSKAMREGSLDLPHIMSNNKRRVCSLLAYCIMPDHYHLLVRLQQGLTFSKYMSNIENSFSRYFNKTNNRKGPLWQSRYRSSRIADNETLLHVHRYIHLNPTTARLVEKPSDWKWSSYIYFIENKSALPTHSEISIKTIHAYKSFVENQISYQRTIRGIKAKLLE